MEMLIYNLDMELGLRLWFLRMELWRFWAKRLMQRSFRCFKFS